MKKIDWYIVKKFLGAFVYSIALIILIVVVFDISEKIDNFIEKKAPLNEIIFEYYCNFIPYFVNLFSALFAFIAVIYFTSKMANNSEFVAIYASGISPQRLLISYVGTALLIGIVNLYLMNFLIPNVNVARMDFDRKYIHNAYYNRNSNIHFQANDTTYFYALSFDNNAFRPSGVKFSVEYIHPEKGLTKKISAEAIYYDTATDNWRLYDYFIRELDTLGEHIQAGHEIQMDLPAVPLDFAIDYSDVSTMDYHELKQFIERERLRGSNLLRSYEYEKHMRMSHPFSTLILALIGFSVASKKTRGGLGLHLAIGIAIAFLFIVCLQFSRVFAISNVLPTWVAAWLPIIVFGFLAVGLNLNYGKALLAKWLGD
ncbi:membrane protein [Bacteroidia bacterium]|nr:membrane protein [Bacteroidia bacterium]